MKCWVWRVRRLTSSATEGREWSGDDDEGVVSSSRLRQQRCNDGTSLGSSGAIHPAGAAGMIHVQLSVVITAQRVGVGGEHCLAQLVDAFCRADFHRG